jgi:hypothetical protein
LLKVFGEEWLSQLTSFMMVADKKTLEDVINQLKKAVTDKFSKEMPDIKTEG